MKTVVPFVDLHAQYRTLSAEVNEAIQEILTRCDFILGEVVEEFEQSFARFVGAQHGIGVSSGLDALRLALMALDIGSGDEVIVPANTYIATALAVSAVGARPVLVDCNPDTYNMDVKLIKPVITRRTRAIIPVHLTGQAADMDPVLEISACHGLHVIEDAAQAHGTFYKGEPCGSLGIMGCFSFYPAKNLGAYGDGGMITTNEPHLAERLRQLRNYGQCSKNEHVERGLNARLDTIQAAILDVKLRHLPEWNQARALHAQKYKALLDGIGDLSFQKRVSYSNHIYHLFIVETDQRDALRAYLQKQGIQTGIHYPTPIHLHKAYRDLGYKKGDFICSESLANRMLSLPMYAELKDEQINYVVNAIRCFFEDSVIKPPQ